MIMARMAQKEMADAVREMKGKVTALKDMYYTIMSENEERIGSDESYDDYAANVKIVRSLAALDAIGYHLNQIRIPE